MNFNKKVPVWSAEGIEPPESLKNNGFQGGYRPPAPYFNWFWYGVSACLAELQANLSNVDNTADTEKYVKFAQEALEARGLQNALTMRLNGGRTEGTDQFTFNGETSRTVNITPDKIGAAEADLSNVDAEKLAQVIAAAGSGGIPVVTADSTDGETYTAIVDNVTKLTNGMIITIIPAMTSTSTAPKLNINGLGAKPLRLPLSSSNAILVQSENEGYYVLNRPVVVQFDTGYLPSGAWRVLGKQRPAGSDIYGEIPGVASKSRAATLTIPASAWTGDGPYTATVTCTIATASNNLVVGIGGTLTEEQHAAVAAAMIVCTAQAASSITLTAFGDKPEIELPVHVLEVG